MKSYMKPKLMLLITNNTQDKHEVTEDSNHIVDKVQVIPHKHRGIQNRGMKSAKHF